MNNREVEWSSKLINNMGAWKYLVTASYKKYETSQGTSFDMFDCLPVEAMLNTLLRGPYPKKQKAVGDPTFICIPTGEPRWYDEEKHCWNIPVKTYEGLDFGIAEQEARDLIKAWESGELRWGSKGCFDASIVDI